MFLPDNRADLNCVLFHLTNWIIFTRVNYHFPRSDMIPHIHSCDNKSTSLNDTLIHSGWNLRSSLRLESRSYDHVTGGYVKIMSNLTLPGSEPWSRRHQRGRLDPPQICQVPVRFLHYTGTRGTIPFISMKMTNLFTRPGKPLPFLQYHIPGFGLKCCLLVIYHTFKECTVSPFIVFDLSVHWRQPRWWRRNRNSASDDDWSEKRVILNPILLLQSV